MVLDGREGRVLGDGRREMIDEDEWAWVDEQVTGDYDHLLIASTLPVLLAPTLHYVEAWNEAVCRGAWGRWARGPAGEAAPGARPRALGGLPGLVSSLIALVGRRSAPAGGDPRRPSIVMLGGDVHQAYLEQVGFRSARRRHERGLPGGVLAVSQPAGKRERAWSAARDVRGWRGCSPAGSRAPACASPQIRWDVVQQPTWRNQLGWLEIEGRRLELTIETTPASHTAAVKPVLRLRIS